MERERPSDWDSKKEAYAGCVRLHPTAFRTQIRSEDGDGDNHHKTNLHLPHPVAIHDVENAGIP